MRHTHSVIHIHPSHLIYLPYTRICHSSNICLAQCIYFDILDSYPVPTPQVCVTLTHITLHIHITLLFCILHSTFHLTFLHTLFIYLYRIYIVLMCSTYLMYSTFCVFMFYVMCSTYCVCMFYVYCMHLYTRVNSR